MIQYIKSFFKKDIETKGITSSTAEFIRPLLDVANNENLTSYYRSWVYAASAMNSKTLANSRFKILSDIKPRVSKFKSIQKKSLLINNYSELYDVLDHPVKYLFDKPNKNDTFYSFMYKIATYLELDGNAYVYIVRDSSGIPQMMYVLQSQYVTAQEVGGVITKYHYGAALNGKYQYTFDPNDILHIKYLDPNDSIYGMSPLEACVASQKLIDAANIYESSLNRNLGIPSGILKYNSKVKESERDLIETKWQRKFASVGRAGKLLVTDEAVDYTNIGISPRDMSFLEGRKWSREEIFACYGVPLSLILNEYSSYANMTTSYDVYLKFTISPKMKLIAECFTSFIQQNGINGSNLYFDFIVPQREKTHEELQSNVEFLLKNDLIDKETALDMLKDN